jgi:hypothetical protein
MIYSDTQTHQRIFMQWFKEVWGCAPFDLHHRSSSPAAGLGSRLVLRLLRLNVRKKVANAYHIRPPRIERRPPGSPILSCRWLHDAIVSPARLGHRSIAGRRFARHNSGALGCFGRSRARGQGEDQFIVACELFVFGHCWCRLCVSLTQAEYMGWLGLP